jgi:predicted 2-oxoglutarate/Fe(II)-dependent dioxygenase YbiX
VQLNRGDMALFSSMMLHRALPVVSGERWSLVCWILGERPLR